MHEMSLMTGLVNKVRDLSREHGGKRVVALKVRLGALSHFTPSHFRDHFEIASSGTPADGARLDLRLETDEQDPDAQGVVLESIEVES